MLPSGDCTICFWKEDKETNWKNWIDFQITILRVLNADPELTPVILALSSDLFFNFLLLSILFHFFNHVFFTY